MLAAWGRAVHRWRWWLVVLSLLPLALWLGVPSGERLDESVVPPDMEAVRAVRLLDAELAPRPPSFGLIFSSATLRADDPRFIDAVQRALAPLRRDPRVARIRTPWDAPLPDARAISTDARRVLVFLVVVFGSVVAAALPLAVGLLGVAAGMAAAGLLARVMPVSAYAANVVSMIGLGVAIDYSLFVVSRYREELLTHAPPQALARTLATAGRTVIFSGMAVGIGLLGMILLRMGSVSTIGIASTVVVVFAVLYSLTLLPALLAILGARVNALPLLRRPARLGEHSIWHRLATAAMARPWD